MSLIPDLNRLIREEQWDATELAQEVYSILDSLTLTGFNGPLRVNTQGSQPGIVFAPQSLTGGSPFQVQVGGTNYNYTFGSPVGSGPTSEYQGGVVNNFGNVTYGGGEYQPAGDGLGPTYFLFDPADFFAPPFPEGWQGGGGGGGTGGNALSWTPLGDTVGGDGDANGYATVSAVARVLSGSGGKYEMEVKGFNGATFTTQATALGLADGDRLDANSWHTVTAYVTPAGADVYFTPATFNRGT